jgi:predicted deacetylase
VREVDRRFMPVHVSIHDVSPACADEFEAALDLCSMVGSRPALLVVPNFHGAAHLLDHPEFCKRLRGLQSSGHEIFLHGFLHRSRGRYDRARAPAGLAAWLFAQRIVSGNEAEMSDVTPDRGRALVAEGETVLREAGLRIDGYVAPAWSMPAWLLAELSDRGYHFAEDHLRIHDPERGVSRSSVVLNWASRSPARLLSTVAFCRAAKHARAFLPARIAIHPFDTQYLALRREIERVLAWARGDIVDRVAELFV